MLSTEMLDGPQTRSRLFCLVSWRMSSMRVVVLPVPGGPWIRDISGERSANLMASCWDVFSESLIQSTFRESRSDLDMGVMLDWPNMQRMNGDVSDSDSFCSLFIVKFILL